MTQAVMEDILRAAGASELMTAERYAHPMGGCRMGAGPQHVVVEVELRSFPVPNVLLSDLAAGHLTAGARGGLRAPARRGAR
ncbi:GMC oxidoreductase [Streptomyces sp. R21]|uniref:GMC oxidoreductase n=1 Tax=Streptomyces sp. R21 TaxID=3238627 RepID=A0AB39P1Q4_9ACTN